MQTTFSHSPAQNPAEVPPALVRKSCLRTHKAHRVLSLFCSSISLSSFPPQDVWPCWVPAWHSRHFPSTPLLTVSRSCSVYSTALNTLGKNHTIRLPVPHLPLKCELHKHGLDLLSSWLFPIPST